MMVLGTDTWRQSCSPARRAARSLVAPEGKARPVAPEGKGSDVYAAGGCMWFMRTGRQPCPAPLEVERAGLAEVIAAAWAADAAARPSGEVLVSRLEALRGRAACCLPVVAGCRVVHWE